MAGAAPAEEGAAPAAEGGEPRRRLWSKTVLKPGHSSARPTPGDRVRLRARVAHAGRLVEDSEARGTDVELAVGRGNFIRGLDEALLEMRVGEEAEVSVDSEGAYGVHGNTWLGVPPRADLTCTLTLLGIEREPDLWDLPVPERLRLAAWRRERGNALFRKGHAFHAHEEYLQCSRYLAFQEPDLSANDKAALDAASVACELNCAATALRLGLEKDAVRHCDKVLALDAGNGKALYRLAQARAALGDLEHAREHCAALAALPGAEGDARRLRKAIDERERVRAEREKSAFRRMFRAGAAAEAAPAEAPAKARPRAPWRRLLAARCSWGAALAVHAAAAVAAALFYAAALRPQARAEESE